MSRNILNNNGVYVNTIIPGDGLNLTSSGTSQTTMNVDISKQGAVTSMSNSDVFILEQTNGTIKKISGTHLKNSITDFTVTEPLQKTGDNIRIKGLSGFTANKILKVNGQGNAIEYADDVDTNFWSYSSPSLRPDNTTDNLLLGTTTNNNSRKLLVVGDSEIQGDLYIKLNEKIISSNDSNDYLQFGNNTFINNYTSNVFTNGLSFGASADLSLATGRAISRAADSTDRITFNAGNFTFGNMGIFNNSIQVKSTTSSNSGNVSFFEAIGDGTNVNNIDLHAPYTLTHDYNAFLPQITDTNITDVYVLSNKNVLGGTNVNISNSTTDTITVNLDTTLVGNLTWTGSQTYENTLEITGPTESLGYINLYSNDNNKISLKTNVDIGSSYDVILPSATGILLTQNSVVAGTTIDIDTASNGVITINGTDFNAGLNLNLENDRTFNLDTTLSGTITFSNTINGSINGNAGTATKIASITNTDIVQLTTQQTLTNKTLTSPTITGTPVINSTLRLNGDSGSAGQVDFFDVDDLLKISLVGQPNLITNHVLTLPATTGTLSTTTDIQTALNVSTTSDQSNSTRTFGNSSCVAEIDGTSISVPTSINATPSGLSEGKIIQYDAGLGGGNGSMVFGDNGSSADVNWDTGIYAKQFINMLCGTSTLLRLNNTPASVASATFNLDEININLGTNNSYSNSVNANCQPLLLFNKASTGTIHSHLVMKRDIAQTDFIIIRQNNNDELLIHHENSGDDFVVGKAFEYGHKGAKWKYTDPRTYLYNPQDSNGASTIAGSVMSYHKDGSTVFFNTTSTYSSGNTNYFSFAKSNDQQARITMDGNAQIAVAWLDSNDPSDRRIKYDIQDYQNATDVLNKIKIKSFMKHQLKNFNNDTEGKMLPFTERLGEAKYSIGVIAQEIAEIPELKFMVEGSFEDTVNPAYIHNYIPIISLLVKSNQEQQVQINELKQTVNELKNLINSLL